MTLLRRIDRILSKEELDACDKVDDVKVACVGPNDVIVLKCKQELTPFEVEQMTKIAKELFDGCNVVILSCGMDIEILRRSP